MTKDCACGHQKEVHGKHTCKYCSCTGFLGMPTICIGMPRAPTAPELAPRVDPPAFDKWHLESKLRHFVGVISDMGTEADINDALALIKPIAVKVVTRA